MIATLSRRIPTDFGNVEVKWDGQPLGESFLAIDTETEVIEDRAKVPRLVLASASDGGRHVIVAEDQVADFLLAHADKLWIMFNAAFDFWVLHEHLGRRGNDAAKQLLWDKADSGELRDGMLLAQLVAIARGESPQGKGFNLATLAERHSDIIVDKVADERYRLGYAELIGQDLSDVADTGWFIYAARDAAATLGVYDGLLSEAQGLANLHGIANDATVAWGPLTETIQVRAAIALSAATRCGFAIDSDRLSQTRLDLSASIRALALKIESAISEDTQLNLDGKLFKYRDDGELETTDAGAPRKSTKALQQALLQIKSDVDPHDTVSIPPQAKGGGISTGANHWRPLAEAHPVVGLWLQLQQQCKTLTLLPTGTARVHPRYQILVWTGRTSSSSPNIQQVPRDGGIRELYVPSKGHVLVGADYSCIEMVTLAQVCIDRYGRSQIAHLLSGGQDLHAYTAARLLKMSPEQFGALKESDPDNYRQWRQRAKAINFGVPGGMGAAALRSYAAATYGVKLTEHEAAQWRQTLIDDVFPELALYLDDDPLATLATNLGCSVEQLTWGMGEGANPPQWLGPYLRRVLAGETRKRDGTPYDERHLEKVWDVIEDLSRGATTQVSRYAAGPELAGALFSRTAKTPTGRLRGDCKYAAARNAPFQGLAADGAKLALFELARRGYSIVAFIHDEILIEVPSDSNVETHAQTLRQVMCEQMRRVVPDVHVTVGEAAILDRWSK